MDHESKGQLDLQKLRARLREKPRTKAGQVRQAWPDIRDLLAAGHSLKDVWLWLNEIGLEIGYARLSHYVGRLRRQEEAAAAITATAGPPLNSETTPNAGAGSVHDAPVDPLANVRERETNRPGFHFNPEPDIKKLI